MPLSKACSRCREIKPLSEFSRNRTHRDGYQSECKVCCCEYLKQYLATEQGILSHRRSGLRYYYAHKEAYRQYQRGEKHRSYKRKYDQLYYYTPQHQNWLKLYIQSGRKAKTGREWYHRIQEEAGCHMRVNDFYPGFRLLKALMEAEIVEIK